jgi:hypothetical protein
MRIINGLISSLSSLSSLLCSDFSITQFTEKLSEIKASYFSVEGVPALGLLYL